MVKHKQQRNRNKNHRLDGDYQPLQNEKSRPEIPLQTEVYRDLKYGLTNLGEKTTSFAEKNKDTIKDFGLFNIYLQQGITLIICIALVYFGYIWYINRKIFEETTGKIIESECIKSKETITYNCNFKIKFTYKDTDKDTDKEHIFSVNTNSSRKYEVNENISIYYDVNDPTTEPSIEKNYSTYFYMAMMFIGVLGCITSISSIYSASKYEFVAQAQGVRSGLELGNYALSPLFGKSGKR
jgi:hypothetical protein